MSIRSLALAGITASLFAWPVYAHHSFAMFDHSQSLKLTGSVENFEWVNPHSWLFVRITEASGKTARWGFEGRSPNTLARLGLKPDSMKPGDTVTVEYHPLRDGSNGGQMTSLVLADGRTFNYERAITIKESPNY